jgi:hypothetical protein
LRSIPLQIRDTSIIKIAEHSIASKRSLQLWSIPLPNQVMENWIILNREKPNQTRLSQDKTGKGKPRPIRPYPCFVGAIFLKFQAQHWLHFPIIKGTLFVEEVPFHLYPAFHCWDNPATLNVTPYSQSLQTLLHWLRSVDN